MEEQTVVRHLTETEIREGLAALGPSPQEVGRVEMIVQRPRRDERVILEEAQLDEAHGLAGDDWLARGGGPGQADPEVQITLMNSRIIQALTQDQARWALAGDQLFVDFDLTEENLPVGQHLAVGSAVLRVSEVPHTGCDKFTARFGGQATRFANSREGREQRRRGINARVVQPGVVRVGDTISKIERKP
jgi:MOSC domain-containing protein YiiM